MKFNRIIVNFLFSIFFFICFFNPVKAEDRICDNLLTDYFYNSDYNDEHFEYLEKRNDAGIFFDFA